MREDATMWFKVQLFMSQSSLWGDIYHSRLKTFACWRVTITLDQIQLKVLYKGREISNIKHNLQSEKKEKQTPSANHLYTETLQVQSQKLLQELKPASAASERERKFKQRNETTSKKRKKKGYLTFSILVLWERMCSALLSCGEKRGANAACRLSSRNSTWGRKQREPSAGPRGDSLHDSLPALSPPTVHPSVGPPRCRGGRGLSDFSLSASAATKKRRKKKRIVLFFFLP